MATVRPFRRGHATSPTGLTSSQPITIVVMSTSTSGASTNALSDSAGGWGVPKIDCLSGVLTAMCRVSGGTNLSITGPTVPVGKTYTAALHWRSGIGIKVSLTAETCSQPRIARPHCTLPRPCCRSGREAPTRFILARRFSAPYRTTKSASCPPTRRRCWPMTITGFWPSAAAGSDVSASGGAVAGGSATAQASVALSALGGAAASGSAGIQADVPLSAGGLAESSGSAGLSATVSISAAGMSESHGDAVPASTSACPQADMRRPGNRFPVVARGRRSRRGFPISGFRDPTKFHGVEKSTIVFSTGQTMTQTWPIKDPREKLVATFQFLDEIDEGETISSAIVDCVSIDGADTSPETCSMGPHSSMERPFCRFSMAGYQEGTIP